MNTVRTYCFSYIISMLGTKTFISFYLICDIPLQLNLYHNEYVYRPYNSVTCCI